jgi:hypothetical protein
MSNAIPSLNKEWMRLISFAIAVGFVIIIILFILENKTERVKEKNRFDIMDCNAPSLFSKINILFF